VSTGTFPSDARFPRQQQNNRIVPGEFRYPAASSLDEFQVPVAIAMTLRVHNSWEGLGLPLFGTMIAGFGFCLWAITWANSSTLGELSIGFVGGGTLVGFGAWISYVSGKFYTRLLEFGDDRVTVKWFRQRREFKYDQVAKASFEHVVVKRFGTIPMVNERKLSIDFHDGSEAEVTLQDEAEELAIDALLTRINALTFEGPLLSRAGLLAIVSHQLAYSVLPACVFDKRAESFLEAWAQNPQFGLRLFSGHCKRLGISTENRILPQFKTHHGSLSSGIGIYVLEYPLITTSGQSSGALAPFFSACIVSALAAEPVEYFVLAEAIDKEATVLRKVEKNGKGRYLGPGSPRNLEALLEQLRDCRARRA
jgi:hypothetical protein